MSKSTDKTQNTGASAVIDPRFKLGASLISLACLLAVGATLLADHLHNPEHFNIRKIALTGDAAHVDRKVLKQSVIDAIEGNYFSLDAQKIIKVVQALPWVETVSLRRRWPETLMIDIEEYQPIAIWGKDRWLTTSGKLVKLPLPKNVVLPHLSGPGNELDKVWPKYQQWSTQFARLGLSLRSMHLSKQHLYTVKLDYTSHVAGSAQGFEMILAESNADQQMTAFLSSYRQSLIDTPGRIKMVDLRYPSGFSISQHEVEEFAQAEPN